MLMYKGIKYIYVCNEIVGGYFAFFVRVTCQVLEHYVRLPSTWINIPISVILRTYSQPGSHQMYHNDIETFREANVGQQKP